MTLSLNEILFIKDIEDLQASCARILVNIETAPPPLQDILAFNMTALTTALTTVKGLIEVEAKIRASLEDETGKHKGGN